MKKSSLSLFKPFGQSFTLAEGLAVNQEVLSHFTLRHHPALLSRRGWDIGSYNPGEYGLFQIQRPTTANELSLALQSCSVSYLPGAILLAASFRHLPQAGVISFASFVESGLGVKRQLYVAPSSESGSDHAVTDKWMIEGSEYENPQVIRDVQQGCFLLVCFKRL